jgi:hypothetical protein
MKQLNILDLHRSINEKKNRINECYDKVLEICHRKIQSAADTQQVRAFIEVPCYVVGYPIFDYNKCVEYVYNSLRKNGFLVKYYFPKNMYVSWDFSEIENNKKQKSGVGIATKPPPKAALSYKPSGKLQLDLE